MKVEKIVSFSFKVIVFLIAVPLYSQQRDSVVIMLDLPATYLSDKTDTLKTQVDGMLGSIQTEINTLSPQEKLNASNNKLDSLQGRLTSKLDSLTSLNLDDNRLTQSIEDLRSKLDSLKTLGAIKQLDKAEERLGSLKSGVSDKVDKVEGKINSPMSKFAENGANVPGSVDLTGSMGDIPGVGNGLSSPESNIDIPSTGVGDLGIPDAGLGGDINIPSMNKPSLGNIDELNKVKGVTGEIGGITDEAKNYTDKIKDPEQLSAEVESRASTLGGADGLGEEMGQVAEIKKWQSDPDYVKEMAQTKLKKQSLNHFAGHEKELEAAMEQLSKLKTKFPHAEEALDMFAKRQNFVKEKTFLERLVPGINLQVASNQNWWFDFNPYVGYRISTRFTSGIGWNERLAFNFKEWSSVPLEHIYGPRSYVEFQLKEKLMVKTEAELMNAFVTAPQLINLEPFGRQWVWSYFAGFKNVFNFSKHVKGHVQVMYNLHDPKNRSPYMSRFNIRFGFEFTFRKKAVEQN